jgi:hypothetical protein
MIVRGRVARLSRIDRPSQPRPHNRARGRRKTHSAAGIHFIQAASAHRKPARRGPLNCAAQSISVSWRLMLPVSRFAPNGNASSAMRIAVSSGRRRYAQWNVHSSARIVPTRHANHATSQGSRAHGANSGSIHGA